MTERWADWRHEEGLHRTCPPAEVEQEPPKVSHLAGREGRALPHGIGASLQPEFRLSVVLEDIAQSRGGVCPELQGGLSGKLCLQEAGDLYTPWGTWGTRSPKAEARKATYRDWRRKLEFGAQEEKKDKEWI